VIEEIKLINENIGPAIESNIDSKLTGKVAILEDDFREQIEQLKNRLGETNKLVIKIPKVEMQITQQNERVLALEENLENHKVLTD